MAPSRGGGGAAGARRARAGALVGAVLLAAAGLFIATAPRVHGDPPRHGAAAPPRRPPTAEPPAAEPPAAGLQEEASRGGDGEGSEGAGSEAAAPGGSAGGGADGELATPQRSCAAAGSRRGDVILAETKHPYICQYMHGAARSRGGCSPKCTQLPQGVACRVLEDPGRADRARADAVVYHPGRGLPVARAFPKQLQVMWYGESQDKHPEKYAADYLRQYDVHVVFKGWSPHRFSWTQRFLPSFRDLPQMRKQWPQWQKRRAAVAIVSNCKYTTTNRTAFMQELDRQLQLQSGGRERLHMFGRCHPGRPRDSISKEHPSCRARSEKAKYQEKMCVLRQYRYVVAMDNSRDTDYVTEKVYHALLSGAVPIYDGAPNIADYIPLPGAILDLRRSRGPAEVAAEILTSAAAEPPQLRWVRTPPAQWSAPFRRNLWLPDPACLICEDVLCGSVRGK
eukprot:TRINITY_DN13122_c0_g1_i1.p1 TRINITY_DN13122_c0_g1~~TRINITY_DN13122_c0_g1_i1.p1  ORF type:complete len:469 (+),score=113.53 TRINITY_DN13122_c0_g1_i1:54-1409(+)